MRASLLGAFDAATLLSAVMELYSTELGYDYSVDEQEVQDKKDDTLEWIKSTDAVVQWLKHASTTCTIFGRLSLDIVIDPMPN